jgi:hypothetical protein
LQVNKRRRSEVVPDLAVNQVRTWSKMNLAIFAEPGKRFEWPKQRYSVLELDINTAPEGGAVLEPEHWPLCSASWRPLVKASRSPETLPCVGTTHDAC